MARKTAAPVEEASPETAPDDKAAEDAALMARLQEARAQYEQALPPPATRQVNIQDLFGQMVALVASATGKRYRDGNPTVSEATSVKILELSLGWALNSRSAPVPPLIADEPGGEPDEEQSSQELPEPNEFIGAADTADEE